MAAATKRAWNSAVVGSARQSRRGAGSAGQSFPNSPAAGGGRRTGTEFRTDLSAGRDSRPFSHSDILRSDDP
ncbi:hypothetical protein NX02_23825 [Sphingomonas sanxanigenens DSM 19645 = NX02]|uniref:Uncharacterized protein n=1 Tax=Sphingomonas sanxanigenens DSM 19645 = NX02 TaxID=1123269 RepID=W0AGX7_9SPHN|nr:hypothetical protein NX02_23825 [Sphingomonas sanxanigenens DSM 19645 = NX02]